MLSIAGVMYMDHRILNKIIGKYGWQFVIDWYRYRRDLEWPWTA